MATPMQYYSDLPPVAKTYGVICFLTTAACRLGLLDYWTIALVYGDVFKSFQIWRLVTNFFFLGPFSFSFAFHLLLIARHGVQLERGPFDKRTADYLWMFIFGAISLLVMAAVPYLWSPFLGVSLVFMIVYVWSREFPNARINVYGLFEMKGFYLPWFMVTVDLILGNPIKRDLLGMGAGHLYYFLTVLYPLSGGEYYFKTPLWVHKVVAHWGVGYQYNSPVPRNRASGTSFQGRSYRLSGTQTSTRSATSAQQEASAAALRRGQGNGSGAFQGTGRRLGGS